MDTCLSLPKTPYYCLSSPKPHIPTIQHDRRSLKLQQVGRIGGRLRAAGCGTTGSSAELERKLEDEVGSIEEWIDGATGKCRDYGNNGIVELMECLETEAIMGDDQGREPMDYNRRAHIFDKSSILFQAIKENTTTTTTTHNDS